MADPLDQVISLAQQVANRKERKSARATSQRNIIEGRMWQALMTEANQAYREKINTQSDINRITKDVTIARIENFGKDIPAGADEEWFEQRDLELFDYAKGEQARIMAGSDEAAKASWEPGGAYWQLIDITGKRLDAAQQKNKVYHNWLYGPDDEKDDGIFDTLQKMQEESAFRLDNGEYIYTKPEHGLQSIRNMQNMVMEGFEKQFTNNINMFDSQFKDLRNKISFENAMRLLDTEPATASLDFPTDYVDLTKFPDATKTQFPKISEFTGESLGTASEAYKEAMLYYESGDYDNAQKWAGIAKAAKDSQIEFIARSERQRIIDTARLARMKTKEDKAQQAIEVKSVVEDIDKKRMTGPHLSANKKLIATPLVNVLTTRRDWTSVTDNIKDRILEVLAQEDTDVDEMSISGEFPAPKGHPAEGVSLGDLFIKKIKLYRQKRKEGLYNDAKLIGEDIIKQMRYSGGGFSGRSMVRKINFPGVDFNLFGIGEGNQAQEEEYKQYIFSLLNGLDKIERIEALDILDKEALNTLLQAQFPSKDE